MKKKGKDGRRGLKWVGGSETPAKVYITRIFNFGTWEEWRSMKKKFSREKIEDAVRNPLRGEWTKHGRRFAETLYSCRIPKRALISYEV